MHPSSTWMWEWCVFGRAYNRILRGRAAENAWGKKIDDIHRRWKNRAVEEGIVFSAFIFFFLHFGLHVVVVFCTLLTEVAVFSLRDGGRGERRKVKGPFKIALQPCWPAVCLNGENVLWKPPSLILSVWNSKLKALLVKWWKMKNWGMKNSKLGDKVLCAEDGCIYYTRKQRQRIKERQTERVPWRDLTWWERNEWGRERFSFH